MDKIRILITDDHPVVLEGLSGMLAGQSDFEVIGLAADGDTAVTLHDSLAPDVTLMDLRMPGLDGVGAIKAIKAQQPVALVQSSPHPPTTLNADILPAIEAGATGYLLKDAPREEAVPRHTRRRPGRLRAGPGRRRSPHDPDACPGPRELKRPRD